MLSLRDVLKDARERIPRNPLTGDEEPEIGTKDIEHISTADWETVLERFTEDMDPWAIDIVKLADRYQSYIERLERFDLEVPGRIIMIGAVLLRMKAQILREAYEEGEAAPEEMDRFEEQFEDAFEIEDEAEELEDEAEEELEIPEEVPEPPVKKHSERKVTLDELKDALEKAMQVSERREERQEERKEAKDYGIEVEEDDISSKLDDLYDSLRNRITKRDDAVTFTDLVERQNKQEQLDKFVHLMHLETDKKITCRQQEWLGELEIEMNDQPDNAAS